MESKHICTETGARETEITRKHGRRKRTLRALMGTDFLQQNEARAELRMMKWIWLINHSRSSITLCTSPFSNLPVCILLLLFFFFLHDTLQTISTSPDSTIIIHSPSSALHLGSRSILFISLPVFHRSHISSVPLPPSGSWLKTHTQTDSGTERQPRSDLRSEL